MKLPKYIVTLIATLLFVVLFFEKSLGLNVAIYGLSTLLLLAVFKREFFKSAVNSIVAAGFLLTSVFYFLYGSPFTLFVHFVSFALLLGLHTVVPIRNILYAIPSAVPNYFVALTDFFTSFRARKKKKRQLGLSRTFRIIFVPMFVLLLFVALYSMGSTYFSDAVGSVTKVVEEVFLTIAKYIDIKAVFVGLVGLLFAVIHSLTSRNTLFSEKDAAQSDMLSRVRSKVVRRFNNMDLSVEYKSGVFLFAGLSVLLSALLYLEVKNIWINFEWEGELLKQLVREGTYVLIAAILISMAVTMYYFRKNLNFYRNNKAMKVLAYVWRGLNALLVVSVFVRNYYYISYFGLAYKRIGVVFFLVLCLVGLYSLVLKIAKVKSTYYVTRVNALVANITLVALCAFNWDVIIARYNFSHYKTAFVHLPFMSNLSDKALPYLKLTDDQVKEIEGKQVEQIPFARRGYFKDVGYQEKISERIMDFNIEQQSKHWLEMVWAERKAYKRLLNEREK